MRRLPLIGLFALAACLPWQARAQAQAPAPAAAAVRGTGATFPGLVYAAWCFGYTKETGQQVRYAETGSGAGIEAMSQRSVDFGATDTPLSEAELASAHLIQFPTMAGGIVPVVNLKGVATDTLKLSGALLAELMSGEIASWDDPRIAALNPSLNLPRIRVVRVVREDSSGSTAILTEYLSQHSPGWAKTTGVGRTVKWKGEVMLAKGNDGLSAAVKATPGAIGYVSFDRVRRDDLASVMLRNKSGAFVAPSELAFQAAVKASSISKSSALTASLVDLQGPAVWPIVDLTYILMDATPKSAERASASARFFYWAFLKGDPLISGTGFAALPTEVQALVVRKLAEIKPTDGKPLHFTRRTPPWRYASWTRGAMPSSTGMPAALPAGKG